MMHTFANAVGDLAFILIITCGGVTILGLAEVIVEWFDDRLDDEGPGDYRRW